MLAYGGDSPAGEVVEALERAGLSREQVVVVVNPDGSGRDVALPEWVARIECRSNVGYSAAVNAGICFLSARAEWLLVATHDVELPGETLTALVAALREQASLGAVGPRLVDTRSGATHSSGGGISILGATWHEKVGQSRGIRDCRWLDGTCIAFRKTALEENGGFREDFFLYFEDVEIGVRLGSTGWRVACATDVVARTALGGGKRAAAIEYFFSRNGIEMARIEAGGVGAAFAVLRRIGVSGRLSLAAVAKCVSPNRDGRAAWGVAGASIVGIADALRGRWGPPPQWMVARGDIGGLSAVPPRGPMDSRDELARP